MPVIVPEPSDIFAISVRTNSVVAICVVLVAIAAVGAVGVPVNDGDAIVARNNISAVFVVMLAVFASIALVLLVILAVFEAIAFVLLVMLAVFEAINVGNVVIVVELTPPTLFTVGNAAEPPKSFVNCNLPFTVAVASGVAAPPTKPETNSVVAI